MICVADDEDDNFSFNLTKDDGKKKGWVGTCNVEDL